MPSALETAAKRFRQAVIAHDQAAAAELVRAYGDVWRSLSAQLQALLDRMQAAQAAGQDVTLNWLFQQQRLETMLAQTQAEIARFASVAETTITTQQVLLLALAQQQADALMSAALGPGAAGVVGAFDRVPTAALHELVGTLQDGSPLRDLLATLGPQASASVRSALISGVGTGQGPAVITGQIRQQLGGSLVRSLTVARTELLRSYNSAAIQTYRQNSDVINGWVWLSARSSRTCPLCWGLDGTFHRLDEDGIQPPAHPRCRCVATASSKTYAELGLSGVPESAPSIGTGADVFADLSAVEQQAILGPAKYAAYADGAITLEDLVGIRNDPQWGWVGWEKSLSSILGTDVAAA